MAAVLAVAGAGGLWGFRHHRHSALLAALPEPPDLTGANLVLRSAVAGAWAATQTRASAPDGVATLGRLYHANGFLSHAEACWRLLMKLRPEEARWTYFLADLRRAASDQRTQKSLLEETVGRAPDYAPAWLQLANLELKSGEFAQAETHFRRRLTLRPADPHAQFGLARIALQTGQSDAAREQLEKLVQAAPSFPPGQNLLAELLAAAGDHARAREHRWLGREAGRFKEPEDPWLTELNEWCHDPKRLSVLGTIEYQTGENARARELLERALTLAPDNLEIRTLLAELYLKLGEPARARDSLEPAVRASAGSAASVARPPVGMYLTLSTAERALDAPNNALDAVQAGLRIFPQASELHRQRGTVLAQLGRSGEAMTAFQDALQIDPNDAEAAFNVGLILLQSGRREEAGVWLQRTLEARPTHPQALTLLGRIGMEAGKLDAAWRYLEPLFESNSGVPQVRELVARWHWLAGNQASADRQFERAEDYYRAGAEVSPGYAEIQASLGVLYLTQGKLAAAVAPLEAYHRLQPQNARSALYLGQAYAGVGRIADARRVLALGVELALRAGQNETAGHCREILRELAGK